jgi:hypothetical protein
VLQYADYASNEITNVTKAATVFAVVNHLYLLANQNGFGELGIGMSGSAPRPVCRKTTTSGFG